LIERKREAAYWEQGFRCVSCELPHPRTQSARKDYTLHVPSLLWRRRLFRVALGFPVLSLFVESIWDMVIGCRIAPFDATILQDSISREHAITGICVALP